MRLPSEVPFQPLEALTHRAMRDLHFLRGVREIQSPEAASKNRDVSSGGSVRGMRNDSCANRWREKPSMAIVLTGEP